MVNKGSHKTDFLPYAVGSVVFIVLTGLILYFIFKGSKDTGGFAVPGFFTGETVLVLLFFLLLFYTFDGLRLLFVFKTIGTDFSFLLMIKLVFINVFASGVTPLATGGGFAQIYFLNRNKVPLGTATAATTIRTVIASALIFASVPVVLTLEKGLRSAVNVQHGVIYSLLLIMLYAVLFYGLVKQKVLLKKIIFSFLNLLGKVHILKPDKYESMKLSVDTEIALFAGSLVRFAQGRKIYLLFSILSSCIYLFLLFFFPYILIRAMNVQVHLLTVLSIQVLITFLVYFTPTPGGSGVAEGWQRGDLPSYSLISYLLYV